MTDVARKAPHFPLQMKLGEVEAVQNPALGAYVIWLFARVHQASAGDAPPLPLAFLVLPLLLHRPTLEAVASTQRRSGLALLAAKLGEQRENLLAVHDRALALRRLTLQSIAVGATAQLVAVDYRSATLWAPPTPPGVRQPSLPERVRPMAAAAEKLGHWFGQAGLVQTANLLQVDF